jgi:glycosyltransferase involved in cell wall biosynthesis
MNEQQTFNSDNPTAKAVAHVLDSLEVGGLERTVVRLAIAQKESGDHVQVITIWANGPLAAPLKQAGIKITCINKKSGLDFSAIKKIRRIISRGIEVIHSHNVLPHYYATIASLGIDVRRISTRHDMGVHLKGKRMQFLYGLSLYKTHSVVAVCEAAKNRFVTENIVPEDLISVIYNGIPEIKARTECNDKASDRRHQLRLPASGPIVGSIGRLNVVKDYGTLIASFKEVLNKHPDAKLVIAGDGPERNKLQLQIEELDISDKVTLLGERNDVEELLGQFDIFALTSLTEGFSVALVEAAWSGLPIVATDVGGNREIVQDGITGFLTEPGNIQDVTEKIEKLLSDNRLRQRFGSVSRSRAEANWTLELMREKYQRVYQTPPTDN